MAWNYKRSNFTDQGKNLFELLLTFSDPFAKTIGTFARDEGDLTFGVTAFCC